MLMRELTDALEKIAPPILAETWDNAGIQIDVGAENIKRVLIALEITGNVIKEAKEKKSELIITHHPLIFSPLFCVDRQDIVGKYITELIKHGISVYSAHTNFDKANGGNDDYLADLLKLECVEKFEIGKFGNIGEFAEEMSFEETCRTVKGVLDLDYMTVSGNPSARIKRAGVCAGAGGGLVKSAVSRGCDVFITGDLKYHDARYAEENGLCVIDAGHYGTEKFFAKNFADKLRALLGEGMDIIVSDVGAEPLSLFD